MKKALFACAAIAIAVALTPIAFASPVSPTTVLNFTCNQTTSVTGVGGTTTSGGSVTACTPLGGSSPDLVGPFSTGTAMSKPWLQETGAGNGYYSLSSTSGSSGTVDVNGKTNGNGTFGAVPGLIWNQNNGFCLGQPSSCVSNPLPSPLPNNVQGSSKGNGHYNTPPANGVFSSLSGAAAGPQQVGITYSGGSGNFNLEDFYLGEQNGGTNLEYMIFGYNSNGSLAYCVYGDGNSTTPTQSTNYVGGSCPLSSASPVAGSNSVWATVTDSDTVPGVQYELVTNPDSNIAVATVYIDFVGSSKNGVSLDDIIVGTPEPNSLVLLGTGIGLLGLGAFLRRRHHAAARSAVTQPAAA